MTYEKNPLFPDSLWDGTTKSYPDRNIDKGCEPSLTSRQISEIVSLEEILHSYLALLDFLYNVGSSNSILGIDDAGVNLEYKDMVEGEGVEITYTPAQIKIKTIGDVIKLINGEASSINICQPVYIDTANSVKLAHASSSTKIRAIGLVKDSSITSTSIGRIQTSGFLAATTTQWDAVTGNSGGLVPNTLYYLDPSTAGKLTDTVPTTGGDFVVQIGLATSSTVMSIIIQPPIGLD